MLSVAKVLHQTRKQRHTCIYSEPVRIFNEVAKLEYVHYRAEIANSSI